MAYGTEKRRDHFTSRGPDDIEMRLYWRDSLDRCLDAYAKRQLALIERLALLAVHVAARGLPFQSVHTGSGPRRLQMPVGNPFLLGSRGWWSRLSRG